MAPAEGSGAPAETPALRKGQGARRREHVFYIAMGVVAALVIVAGFGGYFSSPVIGGAPRPLLVHLHAAAFTGWLILFFLQTTLVASGKTAVHKRLGIAASVLAVAMIGLGYQTAIAAGRRGFDLPLDDTYDPLRFMVFTLGDVMSFTALVAAGFWYRRRPDVHKRLMLLTILGPLMAAPLVHAFSHVPQLPGRALLFVVAFAIILFSGAVYDRVARGRFHPVTLWGSVALFAWGNLRAVVIGPSDAWHAVAAWLLG